MTLGGCASVWLECASAHNSTMPLFDGTALSFDRQIGYDWRSYAQLLAAHPQLHGLLSFGYCSLFPQAFITPIVLGVLSTRRMDEMVLTNLLMLMAIGLIGFPSYHCAFGLLMIWAAWPIRRARYPVLALNLILIAATPICGGHYIADLFAAGLVTAASIRAARYLLALPEKRAARQPADFAPASGRLVPAG